MLFTFERYAVCRVSQPVLVYLVLEVHQALQVYQACQDQRVNQLLEATEQRDSKYFQFTCLSLLLFLHY